MFLLIVQTPFNFELRFIKEVYHGYSLALSVQLNWRCYRF